MSVTASASELQDISNTESTTETVTEPTEETIEIEEEPTSETPADKFLPFLSPHQQMAGKVCSGAENVQVIHSTWYHRSSGAFRFFGHRKRHTLGGLQYRQG